MCGAIDVLNKLVCWQIRGNMRAPREEVIRSVEEGIRKLFGEPAALQKSCMH